MMVHTYLPAFGADEL
jgi:hypothetical protein